MSSLICSVARVRSPLAAARSRLAVAIATLALASAPGAFAATEVESSASGQPDEQRWEAIKRHYFADQPIADGRGIITLVAPERAYDAALVPVTVRASFPQTPQRYVKTITLVIDENPAPLAGRFHLTPSSGLANISTRMRVNDYSNVRAIAELNDGSLHMVKRYVRAAGGCSAPAPKDLEATQARLGKMKMTLPAAEVLGRPNRAKLLISHPNYSGMQMDAANRQYIPAEFVQEVEVRHAGELVLRVESDISLSENPSIQFYYSPLEPGDVSVSVVDSAQRTFNQRWSAGD